MQQANGMIVHQQPMAMAHANETASSAVAAQAIAATQARYVMAMQRPRNYDQVRVNLLKECARPAFAEVAIYRKPIGKGIEGPSIRLAEAAARCMGNILVQSPTTYDDREKRIVCVLATDLETNMTFDKSVTVTKTVERRKVQEGQAVISTRVGAGGQTLYIIEADDDAILNKENALVSKAMRTVLLRLIPGDLLEEAMAACKATAKNSAASDPDAARRKLVDSFVQVGVQPNDLVSYLKHDLTRITPAELVELRSLYQAIRDGETTWVEVMREANHDQQQGEPAKTNTQRTSDLLDQRRAKAPTKVEEPAHDAKTGEVLEDKAPQSRQARASQRRGQAPLPSITRGTIPTDDEIAEQQEMMRLEAKKVMEELAAEEAREPGQD